MGSRPPSLSPQKGEQQKNQQGEQQAVLPSAARARERRARRIFKTQTGTRRCLLGRCRLLRAFCCLHHRVPLIIQKAGKTFSQQVAFVCYSKRATRIVLAFNSGQHLSLGAP